MRKVTDQGRAAVPAQILTSLKRNDIARGQKASDYLTALYNQAFQKDQAYWANEVKSGDAIYLLFDQVKPSLSAVQILSVDAKGKHANGKFLPSTEVYAIRSKKPVLMMDEKGVVISDFTQKITFLKQYEDKVLL